MTITTESRRDAAHTAAWTAIYGPGSDPFQNPEGFEFCRQVADAVIASVQPREDFLTHLRAVNAERYAAWSGDGVEDPLYLSNEFGGEAGEIQNVVKKLVREQRGWRGSRATVDQLADEIADGIICLDNLARGYGIDLAEATTRKFNETSEKNGFPHKLVR